MKLQDINLLVRKNMKKNRSRTFMTVFAVAIGCSFLIVLASFAYGVQKGVVEKMRCPLPHRQTKHIDSLINHRIPWYFTKLHDSCNNTPPA